ncbi:MAG: MoaD/ThiS family protein [Gemmatimonadaceae bacterium]
MTDVALMARSVRVVLPGPLRQLARVSGELTVDAPADAEGRVTQRALLDAIEARYPMLRGTMRDQDTKIRRAYVRFYACERDLSPQSADTPVPTAVADGREPFLVVGALAGG